MLFLEEGPELLFPKDAYYFPPGPSYEQPFLGNRVSDTRHSRKLSFRH